MNIKDFLELYDIDKNGLSGVNGKACICGELVDSSETVCPKCGASLKPSKMLNSDRTTAYKKRFEAVDGPVCSFKVYNLFSKDLTLYETLHLEFVVDKNKCKVTVSNPKALKAMDKSEEFKEFLERNLPGFEKYVAACAKGLSYMSSNIYSLSVNYIENILNIYLNYSQLMNYLPGYKVLYFGNNMDIKSILNIDYNSAAEVSKSGLCLELLKVWDIKNQKYFETIWEFSKLPKDKLTMLTDIIDRLITKAEIQRYYYTEYMDSYFKVFGILFNKEIDFDTFIRLYHKSSDSSFLQLPRYKTLYKKHIDKTVNWAEVSRLNEKVLGTLESKEELRKHKISRKNVDEFYDLLSKNPLKALEFLS